MISMLSSGSAISARPQVKRADLEITVCKVSAGARVSFLLVVKIVLIVPQPGLDVDVYGFM